MIITVIEWLDSRFDITGWHDFKEATEMKPGVCLTAGSIVVEEKEHILIAQTTCEGSGLNYITIPCGAILRREDIKIRWKGGGAK